MTRPQDAQALLGAGKALVVKLEPGLPAFRLVGLMHAIRLHSGVLAVADLGQISQQTLDLMLLAPAAAPAKPKRRRRAAA